MKKIKMNAAKLQLNKENIIDMSIRHIYGGAPMPPKTDTVCLDKCASMTCTIFKCPEPPTRPIGGLSIDISCVGSVDICIYTTPGVSGC